MNEFLRDVRFGLRGLRRSPGVYLIAIGALAIGIGANTAIFSLIQGILLDPLPYPDADRMVAVLEIEPAKGAVRMPTSPANFLDWREQSRSVEDMTAATFWSPAMTGRGRAEQFVGLQATPDLFRLLDTPPLIGRGFDPSHGDIGRHRVVLLSHGLWERRFGADPAIVGAGITLENEVYDVIGVMPPGFRFPPFWAEEAELWAPLVFGTGDGPLDRATNRRGRYLRVFGKLAPGATLEQAQAELATIGEGLAATYSDDNDGIGIGVESLREPVVSQLRPALWVLFGAVFAVLLIACANVANLLLARCSARTREFAVRAALGAGRGRLIRQALTESLLLATLGGVGGLGVGYGTLAALRHLAPVDLPRLDEVALDGRILLFTMGVALLTGVLFGVAPAIRSTGAGRTTAPSTRGTVGSARTGPRKLLVVAECGLALVLLAGAGLLLNSFARILRVDPGFSTTDRLAIDLRFSDDRYEDALQQATFLERVTSEVDAIPGVEQAAAIHTLHIGGDTWGLAFTAEADGGEEPASLNASPRVVTPGLFPTMGIPIERGRDFDSRDRGDGMPVVAINRRLAETFWPGDDAVGRRLKWGRADTDRPWMTVVAVVSDVHQDSLTAAVRPEVYFPYTQTPFPWYQDASLVLHARGAPGTLREAVNRAIASIDPAVPVGQPRPFASILATATAAARFNATLVGVFGAVAVFLAALGIYGVIAYSVQSRTPEFGVRMALGARPVAIHRMVLTEGLTLAGIGLLVGLAATVGVGRLLGTLLFEVGAADPLTLAIAAGLLLSVALVACYVPARRAAAIEPTEALRHD